MNLTFFEAFGCFVRFLVAFFAMMFFAATKIKMDKGKRALKTEKKNKKIYSKRQSIEIYFIPRHCADLEQRETFFPFRFFFFLPIFFFFEEIHYTICQYSCCFFA